MNETDIRKYAGLMQELGLTGLEITEDKRSVRLERNVPGAAAETIPVSVQGALPVPSGTDSGYISVKSSIVGVFYAAPAENAAPYVAVGDHVKKGQTLCIVEAMKLMNEIESDFSGQVVKILAENGKAVEYGQPLFIIR